MLKTGKKDKAGKKRPDIHEITVENDMSYRGPFNYQHFKVFGWICMVFSQITLFVNLGGRINESVAQKSSALTSILGGLSSLALPFLLIAVFAQLLNTTEGYKRQLIINGAAMAVISLLFYLIVYRYIVGGVAVFLDPPSEAAPTVTGLIGAFSPYGFFAFNIFVDLFLCALTMLFLNYTPRRVFTGRLRIFFRLFALLPIAYEVGCMVLKVRAARGLIQVPLWIYPLLTVKPPMTFVLFVILTLYVKRRELHFRKHGKTRREFNAFLKTRRNSWNFSVFLAIMLVVVAIVDFTVVLGFSVFEATNTVSSQAKTASVVTESTAGPDTVAESAAGSVAVAESAAGSDAMAESAAGPAVVAESTAGSEISAAAQEGTVDTVPADGSPAPQENTAADSSSADRLDDEVLAASIEMGIHVAEAVGFGNSIPLIFLAPFVLLFSYTREPKNPLLNLVIPAVGVILIVFVYLEGIHQLLGILPVDKVNMNEMQDMASLYIGMM